MILRLDKVPVGFETSDLLKDDGGQRRWLSRSATFLPRDPKSLHIEDEASNVLIDPQGQIKEGVWIETSGGKAQLSVTFDYRVDVLPPAKSPFSH